MKAIVNKNRRIRMTLLSLTLLTLTIVNLRATEDTLILRQQLLQIEYSIKNSGATSEELAQLYNDGMLLATSLYDGPKSLAYIDSAYSLQPNNVKYTLLRLTTYFQFAEPIDFYNLFMSTDLNKFDQRSKSFIYNLVGKYFLNIKDNKKAQEWFNKACRLSKFDHIPFVEGLVLTCYFNEKYQKAIRFSNKVLKSEPKNVTSLVILSEIYFNQKKFDKSLSFINRAMEETNILKLRTKRSFIYSALKMYDNAINDLNVCIQEDPGNCEFYLYRGLISAFTGAKNDERNKDYRRAVNLGCTEAAKYITY